MATRMQTRSGGKKKSESSKKKKNESMSDKLQIGLGKYVHHVEFSQQSQMCSDQSTGFSDAETTDEVNTSSSDPTEMEIKDNSSSGTSGITTPKVNFRKLHQQYLTDYRLTKKPGDGRPETK